jgi:hypothetical protein
VNLIGFKIFQKQSLSIPPWLHCTEPFPWQPFACHELTRLCWHIHVKTTTVKDINSLLLISVLIEFLLIDGLNCDKIMLKRAAIKKSKAITITRPWRPIGLWDVKDPTLSRQSAHS